jgi:hypothetical protein
MMRVAHRFLKIEAIDTAYPIGPSGRGDVADPIWLEVRITRAGDVNDIIESSSVNGLSITTGGTNVPDPKKPFRLTTGIWAYDLCPDLYEDGKTYTVHWRFMMTPGNLKVLRDNFTYHAIPARPRDADGCIILGTVQNAFRLPQADVIITLETYRDFLTLSNRTGTGEIRTDAFGDRFVELKRCQLIRFVLGEIARIVRVPDENGRVHLSDLPEWQPGAGRTDKFGYPYPG